MPVVYKKCCICIELRQGCLIIGYLNLIILTCFLIASMFSITSAEYNVPRPSVTKTYNTSWTFGVSKYVILVATIFSLIFTILLLVGVHGKKRVLLKAYLIYNAIFLVMYVIGFATQLGHMNLKTLVNDLGVVCVTLYYLIVIKSYYIVMGNEGKPDTECELSGSVKDI